MISLRCIYSNSRKVLRQSQVSLTSKFESRCQYHHISLHRTQVLSSCLTRNTLRPSSAFTARLLSTKHIDSVDSQDERVTQLYSKHNATNDSVVTPSDKADVGSPDLALGEMGSSIPEPPISKLSELLSELAKEPPIEDLGLGGWTPPGMVQQCLEFLHIGLDMPWWQAIIAATVVVRLLMFPVTIISQRNAAKLHNTLPGMQKLQQKMSEARQVGDNFEAARAGQELVQYMKTHDINPLKNVLVPLLQAPVFISFFMGLRGMANVPVDSMKDQGLWWFTDLTLPDQFYILPIFTSLTLLATLEVGAEGAAMSGPTAKYAKYFLRAIPLIIFPFSLNFPGAILMYWSTSNFITLVQVLALKTPAARAFFKIPVKNPMGGPMGAAGGPKKGFVKDFKESLQNSKITKELAERNHLDEMQFNKAGRAALVKTYKFNPTIQRAQSTDTKVTPSSGVNVKK